MPNNFIQPNIRIRKVNRLIQEELGKIIREEIELPRGILITIISVETSVDIKHARINISIIPKDKIVQTLKILNKNIGRIQAALNKRLVLRYVPKIRFALDKTQDKIDRIEMLINKSKKQ